MNFIQSKQNLKIKEVIKLHDRRDRDRTGLFFVEGFREVSRAILGGFELKEIFFCRDLADSGHLNNLFFLIKNKNIFQNEVTREVFEKISFREGPDGIIAIAQQKKFELSNLRIAKKPLILVVENIEKPGNLGSLMRSAESAGVDGMIVCDPIVDIYNPNVIRSSQGAFFSLPLAIVSNEKAASFIDDNKIKIMITTPHTENLYWDEDMTQPIALLLGSEKDGLSEFWMKKGDLKIKIPQAGTSDSLNVNIAAALTLYEAVRQRRH